MHQCNIFTIIQGVLQFTNNIHEDVHGNCGRFDGLVPPIEAKIRKVSIAITKSCGGSIKRCTYPFVSIRGGAIIFIKHDEVFVRAACTFHHFLLCRFRESSNGTSISIIALGIVSICMINSINSDDTLFHQTSRLICLNQCTDLAHCCHIHRVVLNLDGRTPRIIIVGLPKNGIPLGILSQDLLPLSIICGERDHKCDYGVGFGITTLVVDTAGIVG
mmetsp:Transcript_17484/g.30746  ORF Transcript_17484/g.30746 Transcript_17484/m.30746 type:complete len:217 (-) Transcript_17484:93-743(-)